MDSAAREAFARANRLERQVLCLWPDAWAEMDRMRRHPAVPWPGWCLLPMAAAAAVATTPPQRPLPPGPPPIAAVAALYAWRYSRSVCQVEPDLLARLLGQVPDVVGVDDLAGLPQWCVYVTGDHPEWPGAGLWVHLEHDVNTSRPELRLLLDLGEGGLESLLPIPVYLDRGSLTEALADYRATAAATFGQGGRLRAGVDVRGGALDAAVADLADRVDGLVAVAAYLARPEADIVQEGRPGVRPARGRSPVRGRTVWRVGYSR